MVKRLCKLNRHDIRTSMDDIQRLVAEPNYVCSACARSSADKNHLCKPQALTARCNKGDCEVSSTSTLVLEQATLTVTKKTLKKQKKYQKKLNKVLKQQHKLMKKQQALQGKFTELNLASLNGELSLAQFH